MLKQLQALKALLKGKKTYLLVVLGLLTVSAHHFKLLSDSNENLLLALEGLGTVASFRAALSTELGNLFGDVVDTEEEPPVAPVAGQQ